MDDNTIAKSTSTMQSDTIRGDGGDGGDGADGADGANEEDVGKDSIYR
jgi:hypothetical protein